MEKIKWKNEEDVVIIDNYAVKSVNDISILLPHRSITSIYSRIVYLKKLNFICFSEKFISNKTYFTNDNYFSELTNENCYWAGFIAADGWVSPEKYSLSLQLAIKDIEHLKKFKSDIGYSGQIKLTKGGTYKPESNQCLLNICGLRNIITDLEKHFNIVKNKTLILQPPNLTDKNLIFSFIAGYIDGDGSIFKPLNVKLETCSMRGTVALLNWIKLNFDTYFPTHKKVSNVRTYLENSSEYMVSGLRFIKIKEYMLTLNLPLLHRKWILNS